MAAPKRVRQPGMGPACRRRGARSSARPSGTRWHRRAQGPMASAIWEWKIPAAFSKDMIARSLGYALQEEVYGGLELPIAPDARCCEFARN